MSHIPSQDIAEYAVSSEVNAVSQINGHSLQPQRAEERAR
jgi:hypothetical protein